MHLSFCKEKLQRNKSIWGRELRDGSGLHLASKSWNSGHGDGIVLGFALEQGVEARGILALPLLPELLKQIPLPVQPVAMIAHQTGNPRLQALPVVRPFQPQS